MKHEDATAALFIDLSGPLQVPACIFHGSTTMGCAVSYAIMAVVVIAVILALVAILTEGLTLFAPRSTRHVTGAAQRFCLDDCRLPDGRCPLMDSGLRREDCPLWRFVDADLPTNHSVDQTEPVGATPYRKAAA